MANRAGVRTSIGRALDGLDAFTLRVLEVACCLPSPTTEAELAGWFTEADRPAVAAAADRLRDWALLWGPPERLQPVGAVAEVLGRYPAELGRPAEELFGQLPEHALQPLLARFELPPASQPAAGRAVAEAVVRRLPELLEATTTEAELSILRRLADGPPIGTYREADAALRELLQRRPSSAEPSPVQGLLERGLVVPIDGRTVELPQEVAFALRPAPAGAVPPEPPPMPTVERSAPVIDGGGATAVLETVRLVELLLSTLSDEPAGQLRAGGLGVRDLRRLARALDATEPVTALLLEVAGAAGLLAGSGLMDPHYLPTTDCDGWLEQGTAERWVRLAAAWLAMTRQPSLVGQRDDRDKTIAALSADVERHSAPALRRQLLRLLADLPPGAAPADAAAVLARLAWQAPRRAAAYRHSAAAILGEAAILGVTGYGALPGYARALLDGAETGAVRAEVNAADLLDAALPNPVEEFLLQPDLTAVVPGPPTPRLQRELALVADLESTGGAAVYRISPGSLRRALDHGWTGADLLRFFTATSRTPVPQALEYLVGDAATQHGRLRVGSATSYLRCDDELLLDRVLAEPALQALGLQRLAPTVLVCETGINLLLERLRGHGFAPAAETADGSVLTLAGEPARVPARRQHTSRVRSTPISDGQLTEVISRLRASEKLAAAISNSTSRVSQEVPGVTTASILELLRTAVRQELTIAIGYVDDTGRPTQRTLLPISLGGGMIRGHDPDDTRLRSYPLQRITTVSLLTDD
ncbi:MAG TPA: helicase-associated domain-containing protein [Jatrophihabitans sp.]|nr:helicase-associated domain-containing protein [Jatrophihabitans sp.]